MGAKVVNNVVLKQSTRPDIDNTLMGHYYAPGYELYFNSTLDDKLYPTIRYNFHFGPVL